MNINTSEQPLSGIKVLELGQLIAGPFASCILGYFGAEVIKVESPQGGDPLRGWRNLDERGTSYWWQSIARNKKSLTINLYTKEGREIVRELIPKVDILIENFKPGTMEKWGLSPKELKKINKDLIYARVSGYGQTGPYKDKPGFASVCEGIGGFRYINGFKGMPPVRPNLSLGDTLAALNTVIGILLALNHKNKPTGSGQVIDIAIYESVFNVLESIVPEYDGENQIREPSGSTLTGIVPTNTYECKDGRYVIIGANGDSIFKRLMNAIGRKDMADNHDYKNNVGRVKNENIIDEAINEWTLNYNVEEIIEKLTLVNVPCGPIYSVKEMFEDPHFIYRELFEEVSHLDSSLKIPAILPKLIDTPGKTKSSGPSLGMHNKEILKNILGYKDNKIRKLKENGII